jgi:hypothetical protein
MEKNSMVSGLAMEELDAQTLDLLPDREEMNLVNVPAVNVNPAVNLNLANQTGVAVALFGSKSTVANLNAQDLLSQGAPYGR